jgi:hypothetical protein
VVEFREKMRLIDLDFNKRISCLEYLLYKYKKTLKEMFEAKPNAAAIKALEEAIAKYQAVFREKKEREEKIASLERIIAAGLCFHSAPNTHLLSLFFVFLCFSSFCDAFFG